MAIYSLHHSAVGKSTQAQPHTAAAHINYITRRQAMSRFEAARLPGNPGAAARYLRKVENGDRANARVIDKVMLALPRELNAAQRAALVRGFAEQVTRGRASWLAAFHDKGDDRSNPHCHLVIRDRDPDTGKRVIGMSDAGSTQMLRETWERHANAALEAAGRRERVDRRSLKAQGIKRAPTIHEGPRAQEMDVRGVQPRSKVINARNGRGAKRRGRQVDYRKIDRGQSRPEYNRSIRAQETETDFWAAIDADRQRTEFERLGYGADAARHDRSMNAVAPRAFPTNEGRLGGGTSPSRPRGFLAGKSALEPPSQRIVGGTRKNESANPLGQTTEKPGNVAINKLDKTQQHEGSVSALSQFGKGRGMEIDDEVLRRHRNDLVNARAAEENKRAGYRNALERAYLDPDGAEQKMNDYMLKKGPDKLFERLEKQPHKFGRRPGSILSFGGYQEGAEQRRQVADLARTQLPYVVKDYMGAKGRAATAQRAHDDALARQSRRQSPAVSAGAPIDNSVSVPAREPESSSQKPTPERAFSKKLAQSRKDKGEDKSKSRDAGRERDDHEIER